MTMQITPAEAAAAAAVSVPVTKLIDSISKAIGALYEPIGIVRKAKAQADANLVLTSAAIEEREILERAIHRFAFVESRRQSNIEAIAEEAKHHLPSTVSPEPVSEDWMAKFFDNCKDVSEEELQRIWARLLAGEVAQPRTFSRRAMETLRTFSSEDAKVFDLFCDDAFSEKINGGNFLFVGYASFGGVPGTAITDVENHLISLGLLNAQREPVPCRIEDWHIDYCGKAYVVPHNAFAAMKPFSGHAPKLEIRRFTIAGNELAKIVSRTLNRNFAEGLKKTLLNYQVQLLSEEEFHRLKEQRENNRRNSN